MRLGLYRRAQKDGCRCERNTVSRVCFAIISEMPCRHAHYKNSLLEDCPARAVELLVSIIIHRRTSAVDATFGRRAERKGLPAVRLCTHLVHRNGIRFRNQSPTVGGHKTEQHVVVE